jgi:hypothetical protein
MTSLRGQLGPHVDCFERKLYPAIEKERQMKGFHTLQGFLTGDEPDQMQPIFAHHATLRIFSETGLDFEGIGSALGLIPTTTGRRGDKVGPRSPPNKGDVWMYRASTPSERDLHEHIDDLWQVLKPHGDFLRRLKAHATVEVFLGYSSNIDHAGVKIPPKSLEMFTALELDLLLNIVVVVDALS